VKKATDSVGHTVYTKDSATDLDLKYHNLCLEICKELGLRLYGSNTNGGFEAYLPGGTNIYIPQVVVKYVEKRLNRDKQTKYLVYSREHNAWLGPHNAGYPIVENEAGRYTLEEAKRICIQPPHRGGDSGYGPTMFYMLAPESIEYKTSLLNETLSAVAAAYSGLINYYNGEPKELVARLKDVQDRGHC